MNGPNQGQDAGKKSQGHDRTDRVSTRKSLGEDRPFIARRTYLPIGAR